MLQHQQSQKTQDKLKNHTLERNAYGAETIHQKSTMCVWMPWPVMHAMLDQVIAKESSECHMPPPCPLLCLNGPQLFGSIPFLTDQISCMFH